ncbi:ABC transporter substrate-binding protein [Tannockella kyphosi]|uniref:ABC transporter substrate-binding protein n=1 Tax=Tannockella kyphosi TaxID=2899121 RepID=UPI002012184A|nr:ABC transporter substrate-binding protein [Tannockella kyphosi]
MNIKKIISTVAVASMLVGCSTSTDSGSTELSEGDTVYIGYIGPLTGSTSSYGIPVANSVELAIADYNASEDAKYVFELIQEDSAGDETQAVNAYNSLVADGVVGIIGPVLTAESLAVANASADDLTPIISSSASGDSVTLATDGTTRTNFFRTCANDSQGGSYIASKVGDGTIEATSVAILTNSDSDYSIGCTDAFVEQAEADGVEIVYSESYPSTTTDFSTYIDSILASGADAVFIPDYYETIALMVNQFSNRGYDGIFLGTDGWDGVLDIEGVDTSLFNGSYYTNTFDARVDAIVAYEADYLATYGSSTNMFGTMAYDATMILIAAVEATGTTDAATICEALAATDYDGITGNFQFDDSHNPTKDLVIKTITDGAYSYLD